MRKIKVCYILPYFKDGDVDLMARFLQIKALPFAQDFVYDDESPDYLVASPFIYTKLECLNKFRRLASRKNMIRIFFYGECISPDMNLFDYAVPFDRKLSDMDRLMNLPVSIFWLNGSGVYDDAAFFKNDLTESEARKLLAGRKRFCNFLYGDSKAHPSRDRLFHAVNGYKHVDSLGKHINNIGTLISVGGGGGIKNQAGS